MILRKKILVKHIINMEKRWHFWCAKETDQAKRLVTFKNIISGIQFHRKKDKKNLKHCL